METIYHNTKLLIEAAQRGEAAEVQRLIPVSDPKYHDSEALRWAAENGHVECVRLLIPVSDPKDDNNWAMYLAGINNHINCVDLLFDVCDVVSVMEQLQAEFYGCPQMYLYLEQKINQQQRDLLYNATQSNNNCGIKRNRKI